MNGELMSPLERHQRFIASLTETMSIITDWSTYPSSTSTNPYMIDQSKSEPEPVDPYSRFANLDMEQS